MFFLSNAATDGAVEGNQEVVEKVTALDKFFSFDWGLPEALQKFVNKCKMGT